MKPLALITEPGRISWRAILAGAIVALSIHLLLTTLGAGITAFFARPSATDAPVKVLAIGTAVAWTLSALISLCAGGCLAGKLAAPGDAESGKIHGFIVWSLATVVAFLLLVLGVGGVVGGAARLAGSAVQTAGKVVAEAAPDLAKKGAELLDGYAAEVTIAEKPLTPAAKRELARSLKNLLTGNQADRAANRQAVVNVLVTNGAMSAEDAAKTVDEWVVSYDRTVQEAQAVADAAAQKAREIADRAAVATGAAATWTFVAFWLGALAAAWGGRCGAVGCSRDAVPGTPRTTVS